MHSLSDKDVTGIIRDLHHRYSDVADRDEVEAAVASARAGLEAVTKHPEFLAILVEKRARAILIDAARERGEQVHRVPDLLFVCVHNQGRSPMAAAFTEHYGGEHVHVRSAGIRPEGDVNPMVIQVMRERGIDVHDYPSAVMNDVRHVADVVVHVGDHIPDLPGKRQITWSVPDPYGQPVEVVREIADDIEHRVRDLLASLEIVPAS
ncbi:MAG: low molecular weight phosphatase family protein [Dermatophilaceae bacterium]|nr:arsenate reductase ArsC [Intrasporangiaceae bacterium]